MICDKCLHADVCGAEGVYEEALTYCADFIGWIPVSERLPKANEFEDNVRKYYLVQTVFNDMLVAYYDGRHWSQIHTHHSYIKEEIVAWMPLPKAYREVEE